MLENLHWLGHAAFRWEGSKIIYFDPWKLPLNAKKGDFILISHEHFDHYSISDLKIISSKDAIIITTINLGKQLQGESVLCKEIKTLMPGNSIEISGIKITAVFSYNTNKQFHPKNSHKLGFIVDDVGRKIYHAGDTDLIPQMKDYHCDLALLPVSGTYVMTADEAAQAALMIKPKIAVPMHYGEIIGSQKDAERFKDLLKGKIEVAILKKES